MVLTNCRMTEKHLIYSPCQSSISPSWAARSASHVRQQIYRDLFHRETRTAPTR